MEKILLVDDEPNILEAYQRQLRKHYQVETAEGGVAGLETLATKGPFAVVVSDYRMPGMDGTQFLSRVKERAPESVRMMLTGQADMPTVIDAINQGEIFRFLTKPCTPESFVMVLQGGITQYRLIRAEKELLEETLTGSLKALADVLAILNPEAFGRASRLERYVKGLAEQMGIEKVWPLKIAAGLSQIGGIILPDFLQQKINQGAPLTSHEMQSFYQCSATGADLLNNIPRMEEVAQIIAYQHKHYDGSGIPHDARKEEAIPRGARLLKVAFDFDSFRMNDLPSSEAYDKLLRRTGYYDPAVLQALKAVFVSEKNFKLVGVSLKELRSDMVLARDIKDAQEQLLVAKGQLLSQWLIDRLKQIAERRTVQEPIYVSVPEVSE